MTFIRCAALRCAATAIVLSLAFLSASATASAAQQGQMSEAQFAANTLAQLQSVSFAQGVEYCGFIGRDTSGNLIATPAVRGGPSGCTLPAYPRSMRITASYHTHGGYNPAFTSEIPSAIDLDTDRINGTNGYVATPGGRLWLIDAGGARTVQLCATPCLPPDPRHREPAVPIRNSYSYTELRALG